MIKMSEIIKKLALIALRDPKAVPSSDAAQAALLLAHVAWNRELGHDIAQYRELLKVFSGSNPDLWAEFRSCDTELLIEQMRKEKKKRYPEDRRIVIVCGIRDDNVRVEWCTEKDYPEALELAQRRLEKEFGHPAIQWGQ